MSQLKTIDDILAVCKTYIHNEASLSLIKRAYDIAAEQHQNQYRKSGDPYVQHPIEVAYILATLHTGPNTIVAGLLHDVLEDTDMTKDEMAKLFNDDVANIVDGVTKISKLKYMTKEKILAHNHEKLLLAMAKDIRVIVVKIVDRLHNMRTIQYHSDDTKKRRIAKETLELYVPLAHRLGMYRLKAELEDMSFKVLNENEYYEIVRIAGAKKAEREEEINIMIETIKALLDKYHIVNYDIKGRIKNIYSIYKKILSKNKTLDDIFDLLALRIVVNSVEECYQVLGMIHSIWTPIPMRFKDYIAVPKQNMYQSLHTTVVGHRGKIFEIQIRTFEMDEIAELGVAAHWAYKENAGYSPEKEQLEITNKLKWYKDLSTYVEDADSEDPLNSIIEDIFSANVYVFTPNGDVIDLPTGATPLDFAYRIHTDVGNRTVGAIANGKIVPLSYKLKTGDVVEIKTNKGSSGPTNAWLKIVKTSHARSKIKGYLNKKQRDQLIDKGKVELEQAAKSIGYNISNLDDKVVLEFFSARGCRSVEDLHWEVGKGVISAIGAINRICGLTDVKLDDDMALKQYSEDKTAHRIRKANNGSGIIVHREGCPNIVKAEKERFIHIEWDPDFKGKIFETTLKIFSIDKRNVLAEMINSLNSSVITIASVTSNKNKSGERITKFKLQVSNIDDLHLAMLSLNKISEIYNIERVFK